MRQTGEKYTVARRDVEASAPVYWERRGGIHGETAAFANVLANLGVQHEGAPLSEAMILGIGGGLGAGYILWEFDAWGYRALTLGFRREWQYPARWAAGRRSGSACTRSCTRRAARRPRRPRSTPSWTAACRRSCGSTRTGSATAALPESRDGFGGPPVVVYGRSGDGFEIDDRLTARARASIYTSAAGGAHLRGLYADFLDEASVLLGRDLPAGAWRDAAAAWAAIVDVALEPDDELRDLIDRDDPARWPLQAARDEAGAMPRSAMR